MSFTRKLTAGLLVGLAIVGIGATISNRTPLLRAFLQTNLDGNGNSITNLHAETANTVWAGPTTGAAASPAFRALVSADIPSLSYDALNAAHDATNGLGTAAFRPATDWTNHATVVSNGITARIIKSIGISIDGGGAVLTAGVKGYVEVPVACTILSATILADQSGSIAIETWRTNSSSMPPTRAGVLFTNVLTTSQASSDSTLANNTGLTLATQDRLGWNIITNALSVTRVTLQLRVQP